MDGSIIKHDGILREIFREFVWDHYRITHSGIIKGPNVIILAT